MRAQPNYYIISGGPGSGKTSVIEALRRRGFLCVDEVGRQIIQEQVLIGGDALHWGDRAKFLELMLSRSMGDYVRVAGSSPDPVFFDRGIAELVGYCRLVGMPVPAHVANAARLFRYAPIVFVTPPWLEIFRNDAERKQDFDEAIATFEAVANAYRELGYEVTELPRAAIEQRADFILDRVSGA